MRLARSWAVFRLDLIENSRRPLLWIWVFLVLLSAMIQSAGILRIGSGQDVAGGVQAVITSQFANAYAAAILVSLVFPLFVAVVAGMGILRDGELRVDRLLHATPLRPGEYVWGKFLAAMATTSVVLVFSLAFTIVFKHLMAGGDHPELVGPFSISAYLVPAALFSLPLIVFVAGTSFALGERSRNAMVVNMVPLFLLLSCVFFLWTWSPAWLDPRWNRLLMLIDPTGFRWLNENWLVADRGAQFYNTTRITFDLPFLLSRCGFLFTGLLSVMWSQRHLTRTLRGKRVPKSIVQLALASDNRGRLVSTSDRIGDLQMSTFAYGRMRGAFEITRVEVAALARHPAMWLLIPLIVLNATFDAIYSVGPFETPLLLTPGTSAVGSLVELTYILCLFLMFYTVESLRRERSTRLSAISYATQIRTVSLVLGKVLANGVVGLVTLFAVFATCSALLLIQGTVPFDPMPFFIVYGLLLGPMILFWSAFVGLLYSVTNNRFTTYGLSIFAIIGTTILIATKKMTWVWNWSLDGALRWSDIATFELSRTPLILNRLLVLAVAALFFAIMIRIFPRRVFDPARSVARLQPAALARTALRLAPLLLVPIVLGITLHKGINRGPQGNRVERWAKNYWRMNHATWLDVSVPDVVHTDVDLEIEPERRWFHTRGSFEIENTSNEKISRIPITGGPHWTQLSWSLDGRAVTPEDRQGLYVFKPSTPLAPGDRCTIGFDFEGVFLGGFTRNGEGSHEFILPSGVVLTNTTPSFAPVMGYMEGIGVDKENRYDSREYPEDFHEGLTPAIFGPNSPQTTRIRITAPERYTMNSVGVLTSSELADGMRTVVWESDHPLDTFNVVGGLWDVRRGPGTAIFFHPDHAYNIDSMMDALEAARSLYSQWFYPYPWRELRISEFPAEATYAQGFATNITFSEGIGFMTKNDQRSDLAFMVTAHEAAHQWWGGLLMPGDGPGGNLLSEGTAHFSTILLIEAVRGLEQRIEFCKLLEDRYCSRRSVDSERELVKVDGTRAGDTTLTYDKAGWAYWMLLHHLGRDAALEGVRSFIDHYVHDRDHPVLVDFVDHMRDFADDQAAYDAFVYQWFFDVVLPEYTLRKVTRNQIDPGAGTWEVRLDLRNSGSGRMPVEISAERGSRFAGPGSVSPGDFAESRTLVVLGAGESKELRILCDFEPDKVVVDSDAKVLQNGRKFAVHRF